MIRRIIAIPVIAWVFGFLWFAIALPLPAGDARTDAIVVPTGSEGRIQRGLQMLEKGTAEHLLVTGVDREVKPREFAAEYDVPDQLMDCCVTLGFAALDTRGNARETAVWVAENQVGSIRLVTADWHMRRAALELDAILPESTPVVRDAIHTEPSLWLLFLEYHKLIATWFVRVWPG